MQETCKSLYKNFQQTPYLSYLNILSFTRYIDYAEITLYFCSFVDILKSMWSIPLLTRFASQVVTLGTVP